jgi:hypothetical protein
MLGITDPTICSRRPIDDLEVDVRRQRPNYSQTFNASHFAPWVDADFGLTRRHQLHAAVERRLEDAMASAIHHLPM